MTLTNCFISENKNTDYVTPIYLFKGCENVTKFMKAENVKSAER